jgi:hypothetical protein
MALRTVGAELPAMNVRVAIRTVLSCIREDWFHVTLRTSHFFVHAAQRIIGFVVVEFEASADGPPAFGGMAIFARDRERAMRAARALSLADSGDR